MGIVLTHFCAYYTKRLERESMTQSKQQPSNDAPPWVLALVLGGALACAGAWVEWGAGAGLLALGVAWGVPAALVGVIREWKKQHVICTSCLKTEVQER